MNGLVAAAAATFVQDSREGLASMEHMLRLLCGQAVGQILLCNIVDALDDGTVDASFVADYLSACLSAYKLDPVASAVDLVKRFSETAVHGAPSGPLSGRSFLMACPIPLSGRCAGERVSSIMELGTFKANYVDSSSANRGHASIPASADPADPALEDAIESLDHAASAFQEDARFGGGPRPLFWIAPTAELAALKTRHGQVGPGLGEAVRDLLGLVHFGSGAILVEARLRDGTTSSRHSARPTFADAGTHSRFRHRPDVPTDRCGREWGRTVDLAALAAGERLVDGSSERVMEPVRVKDAWPVQFRLVGEVLGSRGISADDDDRAFAERLLRGRTCDELIERLVNLR